MSKELSFLDYDPDKFEDLESPEVYDNMFETLAVSINWLESTINRIAVLKGWSQSEIKDLERLARIHYDLARVYEGLQEPTKMSKRIHCTIIEERLADAIISILILTRAKKLNIPRAMYHKLEYLKHRVKFGPKSRRPIE